MKRLLLIALMLVSTTSQSAQKVTLTLADSFGQRTGLCLANETKEDCEKAGRIKHTEEFTTHLLSVSNNKVVPFMNHGRGGDTCQGDGTYYTSGVHAGEIRGLLPLLKQNPITLPVNTAIVLIGFNDMYGALQATPEATIKCIRQVWETLADKMLRLEVMTYPVPSSRWGTVTINKTLRLNQLIVAEYEQFLRVRKHGIRLVRLDEIKNDSTDGLHLSEGMAKQVALEIAEIK